MNQEICVACNEVPIDVVQSSCCQSLYCWECCVRSPVCVVCAAENDPALCEIPAQLRDTIEKKIFSCANQQYGCFVFLRCYDKRVHERNCQFKPVPCPFSKELCGFVALKDFQEHQNNCCYRPIACPFSCASQFIAAELQNHAAVCPELVLECPNNCQVQLRRKELETHVNEQCRFAPTPCPFAHLGCEDGEALVRENIEEHMRDKIQEHLALGMSKIMRQEKEIEQLKAKVMKREIACPIRMPELPVAQLMDCASTHFANARELACERFEAATELINSAVSTARARVEGLSNGQWILFCLCLFAFWRLPCFIKAIAIAFGEFHLYKRHVTPRIRGAAFGWQLFMTMFYFYISVGFIRYFC